MRLACSSTALLALAALTLSVMPDSVTAQGRFTSTATDTRRITQSLAREFDNLRASKADSWIGYRLPAAPATRQRCGGSHVALEPAATVTVMTRLRMGALDQIRVFTPECDVDTGSVALVWLDGVTADDSAAWLTSLVRDRRTDREWQSRVGSPAMTALSLQGGDAATRALIALAKDEERADLRSRALNALGDRAGQQAASTIAGAVSSDPELDVKRTAVRALARLPKDEGIPLLIQVARTNKAPELRREAMQRLGQSNDPRAVQFFEEILTK
ncbi:MAG TPA: HEAT repeat domain-containing protein [Vicinamibacterales bacterium]|jgi:hypothetical protein|nr:HEAT repeat domain-containing protein [Vicinamibacterales bacterium]